MKNGAGRVVILEERKATPVSFEVVVLWWNLPVAHHLLCSRLQSFQPTLTTCLFLLLSSMMLLEGPISIAWEQPDDTSDNWLRRFLDIEVKRPITRFILKHDSGDDPEFSVRAKGSFNINIQMKYTVPSISVSHSLAPASAQ